MLRCCMQLLLLLCLLCTVFYFVLFWSLSSNNELQLELRLLVCLHFFLFSLFIESIWLRCLSLLTIVIYVAHCSPASIPLSAALSQSQTRCTAFQQVAVLRWCGLHFWNCRSLSLALPRSLSVLSRPLHVLCSVFALLSVLISVGQTQCRRTVGKYLCCLIFLLLFSFFSFLCFFSPAAELFLLLFLAFFMVFFRCTCAKFKAALSSPYQRRRRRSLNSWYNIQIINAAQQINKKKRKKKSNTKK